MTTAATIVGELILGWLLADFLTGAFHWAQDRLLSVRAPFLGLWLAAPSRLHHREPLAFTAGSFLDRSLAAIVFALSVGAALAALFGPSLLLAALTAGGALSAEVHYLAHRPSTASPALRVLQETGLIQSPKHHAGHHCPPSRRRYCVLTDLLNPLLDALSFWARLERGLAAIGVRVVAEGR